MGYHDPVECLELLDRLHPLNVDETHRLLSEMVPALQRNPPAPDQHLEILEAARPHVALAQSAMASRYAAHPLPPDSAENATLRSVVTLWQAMARSYGQVARTSGAEILPADRRALLAQRRIHYAGMVPLEYFRAHRALPKGTWTALHDGFCAAEALGVATTRVPDALNDIWKAQSPAEAFVAVLLVDLANPYGRSERDLGWVCRWAQRFAPYCELLGGPDGETPQPAAYGLDLGADHGLRPLGVLAPSAALRRFDGSKLAGQIQAVLKQFKQGVTPSSLGLGADCPVDASAKLLLSLYRPWGLASAGRRFPRRGTQGRAELTAGWSSIAFHVSGKPFEQPPIYATQRSLRSDISLLTFGERVTQAENPRWNENERRRAAARLGFTCEHWQVADHSVSGFRLYQDPHTQRLEHHQLVGVRPPDGEHYLLAQLSWLMYRADGVMEAGVQVLPGLPRVVAVRPFGLTGNVHEAFLEGFLLPPTPALKAESSLILPAKWFQPQRVIDVVDGGQRYQLRLTKAILRGPDFVQVSYEALESPAPGAKPGSAR
ncbi:MAG: cyclic-di-GMP-binding protein [Azoarcus sp.]|nr:cyclic-di-GMP-binding protein [Azoarcus sp.]